MLDAPKKNRLQRRVERLREVRRGTASSKQHLAAAAISGLVAAMAIFALLASVGLIEAGLYLGLFAAVFGLASGFAVGVKTPATGVLAGVFATVWFIVEIIGTAALVVSEFLVVLMAFSLFSCG